MCHLDVQDHNHTADLDVLCFDKEFVCAGAYWI